MARESGSARDRDDLSPSTPTRVLWFAGVAVCVVLFLVGCGGADDADVDDGAIKVGEPVSFVFAGDAATVGSQPVPASTIESQLDVLRAHPAYAEILLGTSQVDQVGRTEPSAFIVALLLTDEVYRVAVAAELERLGAPVSDGERRRAEAQLRVQFGSTLDDLPADYRAAIVQRDADRLVLENELAPPATEADLQAAYEESIQDFEESCIRHVLAPNPSVAQSAADRLIAGEDWNVVAGEVSLDEGSAEIGGDLGCWPRNSWLAAFDDAVWAADVDVVTGPLATDVGTHVFEVYDRYTRPFEEARDVLAVRATPQAGVVLGAWLADVLTDDDVIVDSGFGTWDATALSVSPVGAGPAVEFKLQEDDQG